MPTYNYGCPGCGWKGERYAYLAEADRQSCLNCGSALRKLFSPPRARAVIVTGYQKQMRDAGLVGADVSTRDNIEVGDATPEEIKKECDRWGKEREERTMAENEKVIGEAMQDLGEGIYDTGLPSNHPPPPSVEEIESRGAP